MSNFFQLHTKRLLINIDEYNNIVDLCWPIKGETNILRTGIIYDAIYLGKTRIDLNNTITKRSVNWLNEEPVAEFVYNHQAISFSITTNCASTDAIQRVYKFQNLGNTEVKISVFVHVKPNLNSDSAKDTAVYYPDLPGIVHYEKEVYLGCYASQPASGFACQSPLDNNGTGAGPNEDLVLPINPVATGIVESAQKFELIIPAQASAELKVVFLLANNFSALLEAKHLLSLPKVVKTQVVISNNKVQELADLIGLDKTQTEKLDALYTTSRYLVKGSFTEAGGTFAAVDSQYYKSSQQNRAVDDYSYFWPRDGIFTLLAYFHDLDETAAKDNLQNYYQFFDFIKRCFDKAPYLLHRYRLDKKSTLGSSWYPWIDDSGNKILPLQLDQTALAIWGYWELAKQKMLQHPLLEKVLLRAGIFLASRVDSSGKLAPSFDLWENHWGEFTSTYASVIAGLEALQNLYDARPDLQRFLNLDNTFSNKAKLLRSYLQEKLATQEGGFIRGKKDASLNKLENVIGYDSSWTWLSSLGVLPPKDSLLETTAKNSAAALKISNGFARYEGDLYLRSKNVTGNPWYISTLWFARYYLKAGKFSEAKEAILYVLEHMDESGLLPEMADPVTGFAQSVKPLIWSHAEVLNLLNYKNIC